MNQWQMHYTERSSPCQCNGIYRGMHSMPIFTIYIRILNEWVAERKKKRVSFFFIRLSWQLDWLLLFFFFPSLVYRSPFLVFKLKKLLMIYATSDHCTVMCVFVFIWMQSKAHMRMTQSQPSFNATHTFHLKMVNKNHDLSVIWKTNQSWNHLMDLKDTHRILRNNFGDQFKIQDEILLFFFLLKI